ncbi:MAG: hypothetical protein AAF220_05140 [Pseudomonadota bacterium]
MSGSARSRIEWIPVLGLLTFLALCLVILLLSGPFWGGQILDNAFIQALCAPFINR